MARGRLRVYLGAAPGVGKTYEMLAEGHRRVSQGTDCVIGFVEPHGRHAIAAMAEGLEVVPRRRVAHRRGELLEMDIDAVLARRPQVALVDELAHTNAAGSRHPKRWQDVEELLEAGIDVVSTLNVQHLESLNDVVAQMTGVRQRETVPDAVVRQAEGLELVDLLPEALRRRVEAGEVYSSDRIGAALSHYFRLGNLTGLRELALLWLADRVDEVRERFRAEDGTPAPWEAHERIVVGVSGGPESDRLIRRAARLVARTPGSDLMAVHVARSDGRPGANAAALRRCRALAESLGGSWHQVVGVDVADALGQFARHENATQLVVGSSRRSGLRAVLGGREVVARRVTRLSKALDVHVVIGESAAERSPLQLLQLGVSRQRRLTAMVMLLVLIPTLTVVLTLLRSQLALSGDLLLYLLAVVVIAVIGGLYPALLAALVSTALADFFFTQPRHSFDIASTNDVVALVVYVATALLVSSAVERAARRQRLATRASGEAAAMTSMAGAVLRGEGDLPRLLELVRETFGLEAVSLLERSRETPVESTWFVIASSGDTPPERPEQATAEAVLSPSLILAGRGRALPPADQEIFAACAAQMAEIIHQRRLNEQATSAEQRASGERRRAALAAATGHVLPGPVATVRQALTSLRALLPASRAEEKTLVDTAEHSVDRIGVLVQQLADIVQARAGALDVRLQPVDVVEVVSVALANLGPGDHGLDMQISDDLPDVIADAAVLTRIVVALADNALRRNPPGSAPVLAAVPSGDRVEIRFEDSGPSLDDAQPIATESAVSELGYSAAESPGYDAFVIGVARDLAETINGSLCAEKRIEGGLTVTLSLASRRAT
jgi:two-component system, OmpR family, sensor histidine kinase KdpD